MVSFHSAWVRSGEEEGVKGSMEIRTVHGRGGEGTEKDEMECGWSDVGRCRTLMVKVSVMTVTATVTLTVKVTVTMSDSDGDSG